MWRRGTHRDDTGDGTGATPAATSTPDPTATGPASTTTTTEDCGQVPPPAAFTPGTSHPCFPLMATRMQLWLGGNAAGPADPQPVDVLSADDAADVLQVQRLMDDEPDGWFGQRQWNRLLTQGAPPSTEVRTNGIGSLLFGVTRAEVDASGVATVDEPEAGAEPPDAWNVRVEGVDVWGCYTPDAFYAVLVKDVPDVRTVEGITTRSSVEELQQAFGPRLEEREAAWGTVWYVARGRRGRIRLPPAGRRQPGHPRRPVGDRGRDRTPARRLRGLPRVRPAPLGCPACSRWSTE
ncbi:MAG TPA: hypothetical protein VK908_09715 [Jiangellales bacterium]|nr:hypothetical protein [Jiangellales bacterium]